MVGFGSSLRISRRRGWEDAYLDYASLRLLLTQIEAVYEEEDWKRGGGNDDNSGLGQFGGLDDDEELWLDHSIDERENQDVGMLENVWRMFSKRHRRKRRLQRRRREQTSAWQRSVEDEEEHGSTWVVSANANRPSPRKNKKDKASHALDKRGWRSPGVTDYRDELFLVSDDDVAFGCDEDQDDWEDTDAEEEEEVDLYDEYDDVEANSISNNGGMNYDPYDERNLFQTPTEEHMSLSDNALMTNDIRLDDNNGETMENSEQESFIQSNRHESPNTTDGKSGQILDLDRADSPKTPVDSDGADVVQSKYETFAAVAARKGVKGAEIMPGSPVEGWLDFIPGFLGKKAKQKMEDAKAELSQDKITPPSSKTSPALGFAETLKPSDIQQPPLLQEDDSFLPGSNLNYHNTLHADTESGNPATPNSLYSYWFNERPVTATALGSSMPTTPLSVSPGAEISNMERKKAEGTGFGVSLNSSLLPSNETTSLLSSSSAFKAYYGQQNQQEMTPTRDNRKARNAFYSFRDNHEPSGSSTNLRSSIDSKRNQNMFSYYDDGIFSVSNSDSDRPQQRKKKGDTNMAHLKLPPLTPVREQPQQSSGYISSFITTFLLGEEQGRRVALSRKNDRKALSRHRQRVKIKRKRDRLRRQQRIQHRRELVPENIRVAHVRASAITERFRGLLRAEVEKIILFANSRLGELSDTIGSLRYSSYEDSNDVCRSYPNLDDGGMHPCSSSDEEERDNDISCESSDEGNDETRFGHIDGEKRHHRYQSDSSNEKHAATKRQLTIRDRLRISRPLFQKAGFLGEDYSLLSLVDEADAYTVIGIELMHLLKFVCVNIIAVRKICKKHDRLLSNRMLGDFYHHQIKQIQANDESKAARHKHSDNIQTPQFGMLLSKPVGLESTGGYTLGIFDVQIQEIANSATMQTVSSTLAVALAEAEASQSRSMQLRLDNEISKLESKSSLGGDTPDDEPVQEAPPSKESLSATKRLRDAMSYKIGGHCFRADDDSSSAATPMHVDEDENAKDLSLTRLQYVVTSVFGLREAAQNKSTRFEYHSSRLLMTSTGPNIVGDGLSGCARETLDFLCSFSPDKAYLLSANSLAHSLKTGGKEKAIGVVMSHSLAAAANRDASSLAIRRSLSQEGASASASSGCQHILRLNTISLVLHIVNYYAIMPTAYLNSLELEARSSQGLLLGVANISSLIACLIHALLLSKRNSFVKRQIFDLSFFRIPFIIAALFSIFGNMIYSYSSLVKSFKLALLGRFLLGFGSCELLNRHLLAVALPNHSINREVAVLVKTSLAATGVGLLFGSMFDIRVKDDVIRFLDPGMRISHRGIHSLKKDYSFFSKHTVTKYSAPANSSVVNHLHNYTAPGDVLLPPLPLPSNSLQVHLPFGEHRVISIGNVGYIMAALWFLHLVGLIFFYDAPKRPVLDESLQQDPPLPEEDMDTFADSDEDNVTSFGADDREDDIDGTLEKLQTMKRSSVNDRESKHSFVESTINVWRLVMSNVAFPTSVVTLFLSKFTTEVLLSSGGTILSRYFAFSGLSAGLFMGVVALVVLPINFFLSGQHNLDERKVIRSSLRLAKYAIVFMINYEAIFLLIRSIVRNESKYWVWVMSTSYDDFIGILQYIAGFCTVFVSVSFLDSASLTLMSKVSPLHLKRYSIDNSFIVIALTLFGRLLGDLLVSAVDVSSWMFCNDIVNSLLFPVLIGLIAGEYLVRKHYFFLI